VIALLVISRFETNREPVRNGCGNNGLPFHIAAALLGHTIPKATPGEDEKNEHD
jgi:hypothetical protein